jgi:hypothetical protein
MENAMSEQKGSQKSRRNTQGTALEDENLEDIQGGVSSESHESGIAIEKLGNLLTNSPDIKISPVSQGQEESMAPPGNWQFPFSPSQKPIG